MSTCTLYKFEIYANNFIIISKLLRIVTVFYVVISVKRNIENIELRIRQA